MDNPSKKGLLDDVCNNINSLLVTSRGVMSTGQLIRDYYEVTKTAIPFRELGYSSLDDFLSNIPHVAQTFTSGGQLMLKLVVNEASSHIIKMVLQQKNSKPKSKNKSAVAYRGKSQFSKRWSACPSRPPLLPTPTSAQKVSFPARSVVLERPSSRPALLKTPPRGPLLSTPPRPALLPTPTRIVELTPPTAISPNLKPLPPQQSIQVTKNFDFVTERVAKLLEKKQEGLSRNQIEQEYLKIYKERLPSDWLTSMISQGENAGIHCNVVSGSWLIFPGKVKLDVYTPIPPSLPDARMWDVYVEYVEGINIFIRIMNDLEEAFAEFIKKLEEFYDAVEKDYAIIPHPQTGILYVAKIKKDIYSWERVEVVEILDNTVRVKLVDRGEILQVDRSHLYLIEEEFAKLPCQSIGCQLYGLAGLEDIEAVLLAVSSLCENPRYFAELVNLDNLSLVLYNAEGRNMNMDVLLQAAENIPPPSHPSIGTIQNVHLYHVTPIGNLYLQPVKKPINLIVAAMLEIVSWEFANLETLRPSKNVSVNQICLIRSALDDKCYRVKIISEPSASQQVEVFYVDIGNTAIVSVDDLRDLSSIYPGLSSIPDLAFKVRLARPSTSTTLEFTEQAAKRLLELTPKNTPILMRLGQGNPPLVDLYKHAQGSKELVHINAVLELDPKLISPTQTHTETPLPNNVLASSSPKYSALNLVANCRLPGAEDVIPVIVSSVSVPHDFWIQPKETYIQLNTLMHDMQSWYNHPEAAAYKLRNSEVEVGGYYAAFHTNTNLWHRVKVKNLQRTSSVVVLFDYGVTEIIVGEKLYQLLPRFCALPAQAIRARLNGVKPQYSNWSLQEKRRFKELEQKELFAFIWEVLPEDVLLVELIDTSGYEDIIISDLLISEKMAAQDE